MQIAVTFKNLDSSEYLKQRVQEKLDRLDKLLDHPGRADVVLKMEHQMCMAEVGIAADRLNVYAREESESMPAAIDSVVDKLKTQITKTREKVQKQRKKSQQSLEKTAMSAS